MQGSEGRESQEEAVKLWLWAVWLHQDMSQCKQPPIKGLPASFIEAENLS